MPRQFKFSSRNPINLQFLPREKEPKNGQQPLFQIPGGGSHQQVDAIADSAFQIVPCHSIIRLQVADNGVNRGTFPALFLLLRYFLIRRTHDSLRPTQIPHHASQPITEKAGGSGGWPGDSLLKECMSSTQLVIFTLASGRSGTSYLADFFANCS